MQKEKNDFASRTRNIRLSLRKKKRERIDDTFGMETKEDRVYEKFDITSEEIPSLFARFRFIPARRAAENKIKRYMKLFVSPSSEPTQSLREI